MATINLQCNSPSQIHSSVYFRLKIVQQGRAYIHRRSADINLAEIHEEMSELLDKQVNVQKGSLKKTSRVHESSRKFMKKVCYENK